MSAKEYRKIVRCFLSKNRYEHSLAVAQEAVRLATKYGADPEKAEIAGILHDIMKETEPQLQLKILEDFGIILTDIERVTPKLWHQMSAMAYAKANLKIDDPDILNAIRYHTSGRGNMSLLEKVVFIADFTSADRDYDGVDEMRRLADISPHKAMVFGLSFVIAELAQNQTPIAQDTFTAYNQALLNHREEESL